MDRNSLMLLINHFKTIYRSIFLRINMLELIVSLFLMKNDGLGIFFSLKTKSVSQNYPLKIHNKYETILLTIFHGENNAVLCPEHILPAAKRKAYLC